MSGYYNIEERKEMLRLSRDTILKYLKERIPVSFETDNGKLLERRGVFVTLHKKGDLRGCIGYPLPVKPLKDAIIDNSISAAFEDPRFPPLSSDEFDIIDIEISVLTIPKKIEKPEDVVIGRDGIIVSKGLNRGLLLPQVPVEQKWNLEEYLSYGCMKAGLDPKQWKRGGVDIEVFSAEVFGENNING